MKPFDLEAAKRGEPVVTKGGRTVRILCYDRSIQRVLRTMPILALVKTPNSEHEYVVEYSLAGTTGGFTEDTLVMAPRKETRWIVTWWERINTSGAHMIHASKSFREESAASDFVTETCMSLTHDIHPIEVTLP